MAEEQWCIPPEARRREFVCAMEDVLEVYHRPYDERRPLVCLDEASKQLISEAGTAPASRAGSSRAVRLRICPQRHGQPVHDLRTPLGLAACRSHPATDGQGLCGGVAYKLVEDLHPDADKVVLVMDNLNTHKLASAVRGVPARPGALLLVAERLVVHRATQTRQLAQQSPRLKHGVLARQCLDRRIAAGR